MGWSFATPEKYRAEYCRARVEPPYSPEVSVNVARNRGIKPEKYSTASKRITTQIITICLFFGRFLHRKITSADRKKAITYIRVIQI